MKVYSYSPTTGEFLRVREATESPLEPGIYLIPANATKIPPPETCDNEVAVFDVSEWCVKADYRGTTYWGSDREEYTIETIGETVSGGYTTVPPPENMFAELVGGEWIVNTEAETASKEAAIRATRDAKLTVCDWTQLADCPLDATTKALWADYRQELRCVPEQGSFPESVEWPIEPEPETETEE